jgi:hypothetical protein
MMNAGKRSRRWIMEDFKNGTIRNGDQGTEGLIGAIAGYVKFNWCFGV